MDRPAWADDDFCYLTTIGRRTGKAHEIEIWFGYDEGRVYMLSGAGGRADWVRNLIADPRVTLRVGGRSYDATGRVVTEADEDATARRLLASKYQGWREGRAMSDWARTATAVAIDVPL